MGKFSDLKVKNKLVIVSILVVTFIVVVGIFGIYAMQKANSDGKDIYENTTKPTFDLTLMDNTINYQYMTISDIYMYHLNNPQQIQAAKGEIESYEKEFEQAIGSYRETIVADANASILKEIEEVYYNDFATGKENFFKFTEEKDVVGMRTSLKSIDDASEVLSQYIFQSADNKNDYAAKVIEKNKDRVSLFTILIIAITLFGALFALIVALRLSASISKPMHRIMSVTRHYSETGSLNFSEETVRRIKDDAKVKDEIGQTAMNFANMMDSLIEKSQMLEKIAHGDLTVNVKSVSKDDTLSNAMNNMIEEWSNILSEIKVATAELTSASMQISHGSQNLAQSSSEQSATVEELETSINAISKKAEENAERTIVASNLAEEISLSSKASKDKMSEMIESVNDIEAANNAIRGVLKAIDDIAFQTNILSLNAAVEAARAGQHGKGFAVVADEVRELSMKSAEAAKETNEMIMNIMDKTGNSAEIARETADVFDGITGKINKSVELVDEVAESSKEQSRSIVEINDATNQLSNVVYQNSATAQQSAAASEEMNQQSGMLKSLVEKFKTDHGEK